MINPSNPEIVYVDYAIANKFDNHIEINEHLLEYPELHDAMLKHELEHTDKQFSKEDIILDLAPGKINYWQLFKFICKYPKSLWQFVPLYRRNKIWFYDINLSIVWATIILAISIGIFIAKMP